MAQKKPKVNHGRLIPSRQVENVDGFVEVDESKKDDFESNSSITDYHTGVVSTGSFSEKSKNP